MNLSVPIEMSLAHDRGEISRAEILAEKARIKASYIAGRVASARMTAKRTDAEAQLRKAAHKFVSAAIKLGFLIDPYACKCADCDETATCYDHRDYTKPMDVEPVCQGCNNRRGRGLMPPQVSKSSAA